MSLPKRTNATDLSDDELLLFDFVFDCRANLERFTQEAYRIHANTPYTHSLDETQLSTTLVSLVARGLLARSISDGRPYYGLTTEGGRLWEQERRPDWSRFVSDSTEFLGDMANPLKIICSPDGATAERYLAYAMPFFGWRPREPPRSDSTSPPYLVPWKQFSSVLRIQFRFTDTERHGLEWQHYDAHRTWWRNIRELDTLRRDAA